MTTEARMTNEEWTVGWRLWTGMGMTNDECQMTKEARSPKDEPGIQGSFSSLVISHSFVIRHSSFVIGTVPLLLCLVVCLASVPQAFCGAAPTPAEMGKLVSEAARYRTGPKPRAVAAHGRNGGAIRHQRCRAERA